MFLSMIFNHSFALPRFAIPQITARTDGINENATKSDAAKAVQSIPAYVEACDLFPAADWCCTADADGDVSP